jgi:predicted Zn-dependent peptidase
MVVAAAVLGEGDASRLYRRLVKQERVATHLMAYVGSGGDWLSTRDPTLLEVVAYYVDVKETDRIIRLIDEECDRLAHDLSPSEVDRVASALVSDFLRQNDQLIFRTDNLAVCEQQRSRAELLNEVPELLRAVTVAEVAEAAGGWLVPNLRAVLEWKPARSP